MQYFALFCLGLMENKIQIYYLVRGQYMENCKLICKLLRSFVFIKYTNTKKHCLITSNKTFNVNVSLIIKQHIKAHELTYF